jgi:predicted HNH restriction endonuclease
VKNNMRKVGDSANDNIEVHHQHSFQTIFKYMTVNMQKSG